MSDQIGDPLNDPLVAGRPVPKAAEPPKDVPVRIIFKDGETIHASCPGKLWEQLSAAMAFDDAPFPDIQPWLRSLPQKNRNKEVDQLADVRRLD